MATRNYLGSNRPARRPTLKGSSKKATIPMAKRKLIPPGQYRSKVERVKDTKTAAKEEALEVIYELTAADGHTYKMREVIPVDSWAFLTFGDAMIAAGLKDGDDPTDAVGIIEDVELVYPEDPHALGHFENRVPVLNHSAAKTPTASVPKATDTDEDEDAEDFEDSEESEDFDDDFLDIDED